MPLHALITAGGVPQPDEPLYPYTRGLSKALLEVAGKPMIQWMLDALDGSSRIGRVVVVGLSEDEGQGLRYRQPLSFLPNQGGMVNNIKAGVRWVVDQDPSATHALIVSSDIPTIRPEMVDWVVDTSMQTDHDMYYSLIERSVMEKRFPGSRRTYTPLKGLTVCGGDMNVVATRTVRDANSLWDKIIKARKSALKQASLIGFEAMWLMLTRQLTVAHAEAIVGKRLGIRGRVLLCPYAEVGMDVDKPHQLELVGRDLGARRKETGANGMEGALA